ncbi:HAMP domain-containing histidine kinase [Agrobacterium sp. a22-2]|uniref:sensor histidine kinase n=1 Tax=Agrobacterium sp. a22-2 TaxID=2283840 RepID=UPI0014456147|nr:HAMP domain-containing sensor histidine kinase [Agrobacterium sp. a22-2]NKN36482.1 HAMP domain-containing histidine kinase [Agrobacterium sp. a22-2]
MRWRFEPGSIRGQILLVTTLPIILLSIVAAVFWLSLHKSEREAAWANTVAGRIQMVLGQVQQAGSKETEAAILEASARAGLSAVIVSANAIDPLGPDADSPGNLARLALEKAQANSPRPISGAATGRDLTDFLILRLDAGRALAFRVMEAPSLPLLTARSLKGLIAIAVIMIATLAIAYVASRRITVPLIRFAADARRISPEDTSEELFRAEGASEIQSLAESLNTMRSQIRRMFEDRTQMLRALSHDLRTPLTRLRMRAERSQDPDLRRSMLADITTLSTMTDECLTFLNKVPLTEAPRKVDLTSLLQTVATDFSDVGVSVSFRGPRRLAYQCKPQGILRAVSNVIDNAARFATQIDIELREGPEPGSAIIAISDNGPGLSEDLKRRVLEPFFKVDEARKIGKGAGFGLGLPIAKGIAQHHNGSLHLLDRLPHGLVVEIHLPAKAMSSTG